MTPECTVCNVCDCPGTLESSPETGRVASNMRKFHQDEFTVWRCANCGSLHRQEAVDLDYYYKDYFLQQQKLDFFARLGYGNRLKMLRKHGLTRDSSILDFGCGRGVFVSFLRQRGYPNVEGFDPFDSEYDDPSVLDKPYDVIVSFDVIEHVDQPRDFFSQLTRQLSDDGLLVVSTPNADYLPLSFPQAMRLHQPFHQHILSERALLDLGQQHGLRAVEVRRRFWLDTLVPAGNARFVREYVYRAGGLVDVTMEPPRVGMVLASPRLWFFAIAGYFFPERTNMLIFFRRG